MKIRPQKHVRLGFLGKSKKQNRSNQTKTRKELRKEKRQQKKINRFNYHSRKKSDRYLRDEDEEESAQAKRAGKQKRASDSEEDDFDDEEIESDFEDEIESGGEAVTKGKGVDNGMSQLEKERQEELRELKNYEHGLREKRIAQLEAANEEDDLIIKKYEKLLKINRRKNKEGVPKSFNDGLDYALELCSDDNVRKMYEAAKEAADMEQNSEDEFADDFGEVLGRTKKSSAKKEDGKGKGKKAAQTAKDKKRMEKLKEFEKKHLGVDDDVDSLGGFDSELEMELDENAEEDYSENDELYDSEEEIDNEDVSDEEEEEPAPKKKKTKKVTFEEEKSKKSKDKKKKQSESEKEEEPARKKKKTKKAEEAKPKNGKTAKKKQLEVPESELEEDSEFDEDVFGSIGEDSDSQEEPLEETNAEGTSESKEKESTNTWEDIYGRKRDKDGNVIKEESSSGKYIPPHLRARMESGTPADAKQREKLQRLRRQLKGQINRLAESNVHKISIELDNLYMQHARFDMNNTLTDLVLEAIVSPSLAPERMVLEHTLLVTILHANVGSEVGSHFLETVVERFNSLIAKIDTFDVEDKTLDNCVFILCHLYTYQIFKNKLMYDVIDQLLSKFSEKAVECILLVLRSIGFVLRKDDPLALKEMIQKVQRKAAEASEEMKNDARVKFMLNILLAVKNNNMNKIPQYDPTLVEHFRKILKGMITKGKYVSTLNIGLDDLLNVDERGKWWLVGSAWHGNKDDKGADKPGSSSSGKEGAFSQQLQELAQKQRMNTDDKRSVFCAIMSAEDYLDAFDKILRLAIKDQRVVVTVIIHCCLSEKDYNPYYSVLSQKFCEYDRRYQLALQYAVWDRLKDIHALKQAPARNLAKLLAHLIAEGGLALSVLKVIEFAEIDKVTLRLVRQIMLGILLLEDENKCLQVFNRIAPSFKLKAFKDSLRLFLHHFLLKGSDKSSVPEEEMQLLQQRISLADRMLDTSESRVKF
ncbi:nucleolar MIF4G domain-containing protein 1 homolog [Sabethes cyaneus]|uniref:nucleolar MIF4G domain-containing protein 1 homolog n=1 Tax=Sabethes cyaneus TaxID=53552 RepID=UPI00237E6802|nr:nucleolar MIF4G domain-containing protein 1 homolog [Sabethes cyaneus]